MADLRDELRKAVRNFEQARVKRDRAIWKATKAGMTRRAVAEATGLSTARVHQIVEAERGAR